LFIKGLKFSPLLILSCFTGLSIIAQVVENEHDTLPEQDDTLRVQFVDSLFADTLLYSPADSVLKDTVQTGSKKRKKSPLDAEVKYNSRDSMRISITNQNLYMYGQAKVNYQDIELTADYIEFDMSDQVVYATALSDTIEGGDPVFTQGGETFESKKLTYNFNTEKGLIEQVVTEQGEGILHSKITKRHANAHIHVKGGKYTTCDADHPHFYLGLTKAIAIPDDKIVSGPAYMVLEDVPLPIGLPFGFFPNSRTRASGLVIPTYGEENTRGFYLRNGGWYFALGDHVDLRLLGDVYSKGTWGITAQSNYRWRYKFSGGFSFRRYVNYVDDREAAKSIDYSLKWNHSQDPKANPTSTFSANVDLSSTKYDERHSYNMQQYLSSTKQSSISYTKRWPGSPFNFSTSLNHSQNSNTKNVNLNLPKAAFSMSRIYPFRAKNRSGDFKIYENITTSYSANVDNRINIQDSLMFTPRMWDHMKSGFKHSIPFSVPIKIFNLMTLSPSIGYEGYVFTKYTDKYWSLTDSSFQDTTINKITYVDKFNYVPSFSLSLDKRVYGMFQNRRQNGYVAAVRHVISPSATISYTPGREAYTPDYYKTVYSPDGTDSTTFSIYENEIYQPPGATTGSGQRGSISLRLGNNLEMKVRPRNDTTGELKKVAILENLNFSTAFNPFKEEFKWNDVSMTGGTNILDRKIDIRFGSTFSPYALDEDEQKIDEFEFNKTGKLFRITRTNLNIGLSFRSTAGGKSEDEETGRQVRETAFSSEQEMEQLGTEEELHPTSGYYYGDYVDFNIPWSFRFSFDWTYSKPRKEVTVGNTLRLSGDFSLTPKWKIGMNTGYDIIKKQLATTNINIHRDLHCWEMRFTMVPFGPRKSYSFTINAKSTLLRDLKLDKKGHWYDNY